ncbi:MAG: hypothetical protein HY928_16125 [Elusimicrobia bacterium]|nr:hypothetical protein [Elusimicrobiota bacterium]
MRKGLALAVCLACCGAPTSAGEWKAVAGMAVPPIGAAGPLRGDPADDARRQAYADVWRALVRPARDFPAADPRVGLIMRGFMRDFDPLIARMARIEADQAAAVLLVEESRAAAQAKAAWLHAEDRKAVEELGLTGASSAALEAEVAKERRECEEYMGRVRSAHAAAAEWARAVRTYNSVCEELDLVRADCRRQVVLVRTFVANKLANRNRY